MRKTSISYHTRSKGSRLLSPLKTTRIKSISICPSHLYPYFIKDTFTRWYKDHIKKLPFTSSFLCEKGMEFESLIISTLRKKYKTITVQKRYSLKGVKKTIKYINQKRQIIFSAPILSKNNNIYGIVDILMRNDIFEDCFSTKLNIPNSPNSLLSFKRKRS